MEPFTTIMVIVNSDKYLADSIFGKPNTRENIRSSVHSLVMEKNFYWLNDFKVPNGVHVYGRRYNPFGPQNYPYEIEKTREYTRIRDEAIWATLKGKTLISKQLNQKVQNYLMYLPIIYPPIKIVKMGTSNTLRDRKPKLRFKSQKAIKSNCLLDEKTFPDLQIQCNYPSIIKVVSGSRLWPVIHTTELETPYQLTN